MLILILLAKTLTFLGTVMIAFAALRVHHRVLHEHKIDKFVFKEMKLERKIGITGVIFTAIGFFMEIALLIFGALAILVVS